MKLGVVLPTFTQDPDVVFAAAEDAVGAGIDGMFCYDHLWPLGEPGAPAISPFPLLGALAARFDGVRIGTLVARVGLVSNEALLGEVRTVDAISSGRFIAGVGTGDAKSAAENLAYGVPYVPASERLADLGALVSSLVDLGIETWVGGRSPNTAAVARHYDVSLNLWSATPSQIRVAAMSGPVNWAGGLPRDDTIATELLSELNQAGATWAVFSWPESVDPIVHAARRAGISVL